MSMYARISTVDGDASKIDNAIAIINEKVIPTLKDMKGFRAANFMADRTTGRLVGISFWDDKAGLDGSAEGINSARNEVADALGGKVTSVESFEQLAQSW